MSLGRRRARAKMLFNMSDMAHLTMSLSLNTVLMIVVVCNYQSSIERSLSRNLWPPLVVVDFSSYSSLLNSIYFRFVGCVARPQMAGFGGLNVSRLQISIRGQLCELELGQFAVEPVHEKKLFGC